jgi:hypothetical protein
LLKGLRREKTVVSAVSKTEQQAVLDKLHRDEQIKQQQDQAQRQRQEEEVGY